MTLTRRQFAAGLGAGLMMLPLTSRKSAAATVRSPKRLVFMTSVGMAYSDWQPLSSPGSALQLNVGTTGLQSVIGDVMLVGGLPMPYTGENHGSVQHTTGLDFGNNYKGASLETFIAQALNPNTAQQSMLLGADAKDGSYFKIPNQTLQTIDSPLDAFTLAFPNGPVSKAAVSGTPARADIAALVQKQITALSGRVGAAEQQKLSTYAQSLAKISPAAATTSGGTTSSGGTTGAGSGTTSGGTTSGGTTGTSGSGTTSTAVCNPQTPNLNGASPSNAGDTAAVGKLQMQLIPALLGCDVTRVVGMQWGTTAVQTLTTSVDTSDEHANWHSGTDRETARVAQENYLCSQFAGLVSSLKQMADPLVSGTSMLDNTLILWVRDIGNAPDHTQAQVPIVMAGATGYLKYNGSGGTYYNLAGQGSLLNVLLNAIEAMGVSFGSFGSPNGAQTGSALSAIKL